MQRVTIELERFMLIVHTQTGDVTFVRKTDGKAFNTNVPKLIKLIKLLKNKS